MWRCIPLVLILCLCVAPALAQVPQAQGGLSAADYKHDVARAIDLASRQKELVRRHDKKEIDDEIYDLSQP